MDSEFAYGSQIHDVNSKMTFLGRKGTNLIFMVLYLLKINEIDGGYK